MRAAILALALGVAHAAQAQPTGDMERAKQLYNQANTEMANGKYADAARDYGDAYSLTKDPVLFFKIAGANEKAGRCDIAIIYYSRFVKEASPKPEHAQLAKERIKACGGTVPDTSGTPPPKPVPAPVPTPTPTPAPEPAPAPATAPPPHHVKISGGGHDGAWLLVGGSLAFITAGAVLAYSANSSEQDLKDLYAGVNNVPPTYDSKTAARYHDLIDEGHRYEYLSWASFGIAGACAIGAAIWFARGDHEEHADRVGVAPLVTPHETGLAALVRF